MNKKHAGTIIVLTVFFFIFVAIVTTRLPPLTDPGVETPSAGVAIVEEGEQLVLWIPSGRSAEKITIKHSDKRVTIDGLLFIHMEETLNAGCHTFWIRFIYSIEACRIDRKTVEFKWYESIIGLRIAK